MTIWRGWAPWRGTTRLMSALALAFAWRVGAQGRTAAPVLEAFDFRDSAAVQVLLPHRLREISGLAVSADGRLFAHGDETGVISELNPLTGVIERRFSLGKPAIRDDFEGIAIAGDRFFLITSTGRLYEAREGAHGDGVPFTAVDTGFGALCEIEGLAYEPLDRVLLIGCKQELAARRRGRVTIFRWSLERAAPAIPASITIDLPSASGSTESKNTRVSSIEVDPRTGHYVVIAGPHWQLIELTREGHFVAARKLSRPLHAQPEGLTFLGDSLLLVGGEGGKGRARLTLYHRAP